MKDSRKINISLDIIIALIVLLYIIILTPILCAIEMIYNIDYFFKYLSLILIVDTILITVTSCFIFEKIDDIEYIGKECNVKE